MLRLKRETLQRAGRMLETIVQRGRRREITGGVMFSPAHPELPRQLFHRWATLRILAR